jgi:hypothetical protein
MSTKKASTALLQDLDYFLNNLNNSPVIRSLSLFQGKTSCSVCSLSLAPIDWALNNQIILDFLMGVAEGVCES